MSVITQMLEDLEKRKSSNKQVELLADKDPEKRMEIPGISYSRILKIILISSGVVFLGVAFYKHGDIFQNDKAGRAQPPVVSKSRAGGSLMVATPPKGANKVVKNLLTQISLTHATTTRLQLHFNRPASYEVQDKLDLGIWQVTFDNTEVSSTVMPVAVTNTLIKTLEMHPLSDKLQLRLTFLKPAQVQSMMVEQDDGTQFLIEIEPRKEGPQQGVEQLPPELEEVVPPSAPVSLQPPSHPASPQHPVKIKRVLSSKEKSEELFQEGLSLIENEQYEKATDKLKESLSVFPDHHAARETSIKLHLKLGHLLEAEQYLNEGMMRASSHLPFVKLKARLLVEEKQPKQALMLLRSQEKIGNSDPEYLNFMAALYRETGDGERAISFYKQALRRGSHNWRGQMGLAIALEEQGDEGGALEAYRVAWTNSEIDATSKQFVEQRIRVLGKR